jgi:2-polyprenyl-3-methyl-5-hydroxy-6-metoxy-1,4-benzoquinol methylase
MLNADVRPGESTNRGFVSRMQERELPPENVYGHTKKVVLLLAALDRLRLQLQRGLHILDVGCGNGGAVTRHIADPADQVIGIDCHEPSIDYARREFGRPGLNFRVGTVEALSEQDGRFDAIVMTDLLEHVWHPDALLRTVRACLAQEGRLLVSIPNGYGSYEIESSLSRVPLLGPASLRAVDLGVAILNKAVFVDAWTRVVDADAKPYNHESGHVNFFSRRRFLTLATDSGFVVVDERALSFMSGPYTNYLFAPSRTFCRLNTEIADRLPLSATSAWFFELALTGAVGRSGVARSW